MTTFPSSGACIFLDMYQVGYKVVTISKFEAGSIYCAALRLRPVGGNMDPAGTEAMYAFVSTLATAGDETEEASHILPATLQHKHPISTISSRDARSS